MSHDDTITLHLLGTAPEPPRNNPPPPLLSTMMRNKNVPRETQMNTTNTIGRLPPSLGLSRPRSSSGMSPRINLYARNQDPHKEPVNEDYQISVTPQNTDKNTRKKSLILHSKTNELEELDVDDRVQIYKTKNLGTVEEKMSLNGETYYNILYTDKDTGIKGAKLYLRKQLNKQTDLDEVLKKYSKQLLAKDLHDLSKTIKNQEPSRPNKKSSKSRLLKRLGLGGGKTKKRRKTQNKKTKKR
jgi:hypothetical protein